MAGFILKFVPTCPSSQYLENKAMKYTIKKKHQNKYDRAYCANTLEGKK